jgi:hypothetical protein
MLKLFLGLVEEKTKRDLLKFRMLKPRMKAKSKAFWKNNGTRVVTVKYIDP